MPIRNRIKEFVDSRKLTPYRFVKETGLAPGTGYKLYNDPRHLPSVLTLQIICDTYEVQPSEILKWVKEEEEEKKIPTN